jgi:hypothetical protein
LTSGYGVSYSNHMKIKHVDHIGINVEDLAAAKEFFVDLGFKVMGEMAMQGELVERVIGLDDVKDDIVMLQSPDGQIIFCPEKYAAYSCDLHDYAPTVPVLTSPARL